MNKSVRQHRNQKLCFLLLILSVCWPVQQGFSSGAFVPGGATRSESYNRGKAMVISRAQVGCKQCHMTYQRKSLLKLKLPVVDFISDCARHTPCFSNNLSGKQKTALNTYFKQRYRLR